MAAQLESIQSNGLFLGVHIVGDDAFRLQIARAIMLLKLSDPDGFMTVTSNIGSVKHDVKSGVWYAMNPPVLSLSSTSAFYSMTWCASLIVHEAHHVVMERSHSLDLKPSAERRSHKELTLGEIIAYRLKRGV